MSADREMILRAIDRLRVELAAKQRVEFAKKLSGRILGNVRRWDGNYADYRQERDELERAIIEELERQEIHR